jgi:hypothetical protein
LLALLAGFAIGPTGIAGAIALGICQRRAARLTLLEQWYERISLATTVDPVSRLSDDIAAGRSINLDGAMPRSFLTLIETGTMAERQAVLGMIARRFHTDYLPVLKTALTSPEASIRVQAAAVAAHIRPAISRSLAECIAQVSTASTNATASLAMLQKIHTLAESGLLDEGDRQRIEHVGERLGDIVLSSLRTRTTQRANLLAATPGEEEALERLLIRHGQFGALRSHRATTRVLGPRARARVRRIGVDTRLTHLPALAKRQGLPA